jgi:hypothetical protein
VFLPRRSQRGGGEVSEVWVGARQFHPSGLTGSEFRCFPEALGDFDVSVIASRHKGLKKHGRRPAVSHARLSSSCLGDGLLGCDVMYFGRTRRRLRETNCLHIRD